MASDPEDILSNWGGIIQDDFGKTITQTFKLPESDAYIYRAESFATTLAEVDKVAGKFKYKYLSHGQLIEVSPADITAYTSIFSPTTDTSKALVAFLANAKKGSPRETVAKYLQSQRLCPYKTPKSKTHINPYLDVWAYSCQLTTFLGPLPDASYAHPGNAKQTHPMLPVLYHHFGCIVPTYEALNVISQLADGRGIIDMASGSGYWTFMLRRMKIDTTAVDSMASEYRTMWISDTVKTDGIDYVKKNKGGSDKLLLMVYPVTAGTFTQRVLQAYKGDVIVIAGTQNANRYTGFSDCTVEEWFQAEMPNWSLVCRIALPSFAGKDEAMFAYKRGV